MHPLRLRAVRDSQKDVTQQTSALENNPLTSTRHLMDAPLRPLAVRNLRKRYGRHEVLRGVDFTLEAGAVLGLVGLNGAGKTTSLQCLLGLLPFDEGEVSVLGYAPRELYRSAGDRKRVV